MDPQQICPKRLFGAQEPWCPQSLVPFQGRCDWFSLFWGGFHKINRTIATDTELELQIFEAINVPLVMQNQSFRLCGTVPFPISNFRNGPFNKILTVPIRTQLRVLKGQYVEIAVKGDYNGRLNIASRSTRIEDKQTIYFGNHVGNNVGNVVTYNGYKGSDTRGHSCVGFRISVTQDSGLLSRPNPTSASISSDHISDDQSANNQSVGSPTFDRLAHKGEWKTRFCMHFNPFHADGKITSMEVQFLTSQAARQLSNFELHFFKKVFEGTTRLYRFEKKYKINDSDIIVRDVSNLSRRVLLPSLDVSKGMLVGLYSPRDNLRICSRSTVGPAELFLYRPQPGALKYTENNSLNVRFSQYKNTDSRGKTCPGYRLFVQTENNLQLPSDGIATLPPRPRRLNSAEPRTERNPGPGSSEQESGNVTHYLGPKPLPSSMAATWRSGYMMMDLPVKKAGVITGIELWLGSVCMSNEFFLRVFEKLPGRNTFKQISFHPIRINKMWISSPQKAEFDFRCKVKPGQYICLSTKYHKEKLNLRSRAKRT